MYVSIYLSTYLSIYLYVRVYLYRYHVVSGKARDCQSRLARFSEGNLSVHGLNPIQESKPRSRKLHHESILGKQTLLITVAAESIGRGYHRFF